MFQNKKNMYELQLFLGSNPKIAFIAYIFKKKKIWEIYAVR